MKETAELRTYVRAPARPQAAAPPYPLAPYLDECRALVLDELATLLPKNASRPVLYDLMLEYPLRAAKTLRPALCIAACRGLGGRLADVLRSATVLELFHNAFLIHDDIEDGSSLRRGQPTLHTRYGVPIAVNVGDGMLALALEPLLDNARLIGLGRALRVLELVARMARETVEGQAIELDWARRGAWRLGDRDYLNMVHKKTGWYTLLAPVLIGATIAGADARALTKLGRFAALLGVAFQIHDDVLNLDGDEHKCGKERDGDLWEGKLTLIVLHLMREASDAERARVERLLATPRDQKREEEVVMLRSLIDRHGSIDYARRVAVRYARRAEALLDASSVLSPSLHREFIAALPRYVIGRDR